MRRPSQKHIAFCCDAYPVIAAIACELLRQSEETLFTFEPVALAPPQRQLFEQLMQPLSKQTSAQQKVKLHSCQPNSSIDYCIYLGTATDDSATNKLDTQNIDANMQLHWDISEPEDPQNAEHYNAAIAELKVRISSFIMVHQTNLTPALISPTQFYKQLGDELRLKSILLIMRHKELCVCELMAALDESQPKISRHLAQLRKSGILLDRRQGQWVYYRLHHNLPGWMQAVLETTLNANDSFLQQAQKQLLNMVSRPGAC